MSSETIMVMSLPQCYFLIQFVLCPSIIGKSCPIFFTRVLTVLKSYDSYYFH